MNYSKNETASFIKTLLGLIAGCVVYSVSISAFYSPAHLLGGGVTGIAQILNYQFGISIPLMIIVINLPLFILAWIFIDRKFTVFSLIGMLTLSLCLQVTSGIHIDFSSSLTSIAVGGVLNGLGLGLIYRSDTSVGGTDIFAHLDRTATVYKGYGAYSHEEYSIMYCVIARHELARLKRCVKESDSAAFFTITRLTGVYGHGRSFHSIQRDIK